MPFSSYSDLQTALANRADRSDLTAFLPDYIALFEAAINRRLRVSRMEASATLTPVNGVAALPVDFLEKRRLTWSGDPRRELDYVHPSWMAARYPSSPTDSPSVFTIEGGNLKVMPLSDTNLDFDYWQRIPALSDAAPSNWLLSESPDLYFFGSLVELYADIQSVEKAVAYQARVDAIVGDMQRADAFSVGSTSQRSTGPTP